MSLVFFHEFGKFCKIRKFGKICEILVLRENYGFHNHCSGTGYAIGRQAVRKTVLCITCYAYSVVVIVVVVVVAVVVFPLLSY